MNQNRMTMILLSLGAALLLLACLVAFAWPPAAQPEPENPTPEGRSAETAEDGAERHGEPAPDPRRSEGPVPPNSSLHSILSLSGLPPQRIHRLIQDVKPIYNLAKVRAGQRLLLSFLPDGRLSGVEYDIDTEEYLVVERDGSGGFQARREAFRFDSVQTQVSGRITTNLWDSLTSQRESPMLAASLSDLFQWDVDFTALQPQDSFSVIVEKRYRQGRFKGYGAILAARLSSGGKDFYAFRFEHPDSGKAVYYDNRGQAVRKAFLKVPFHFDPRVTSGFSYSRFHPIHKIRRPHLGVDYGAPQGTPVLASASGRVVSAGWDGGFGKTVRIRHGNGFTTAYAHLSRIEVGAGQNVSQGQRIGRVGATGIATAAHLDYRVQDRSGRFLNPRKLVSWPSDKPIEDALRPTFLAVRDTFLWRLSPLPLAGCELDSSLSAD